MEKREHSLSIVGSTYVVPDSVERAIVNRAHGLATAFGQPDMWEDLAQEGRLEAWQQVVNQNERDPHHLVRASREQMIDASRRGRSIDSRLHSSYLRPFAYPMVSINATIGEAEGSYEDIIGDPSARVEEQALGLVMLAHLEALLTPVETVVFRSLMAEKTQHDIVGVSPLTTLYEVKKHVHQVRAKVAGYLGREDLLVAPQRQAVPANRRAPNPAGQGAPIRAFSDEEKDEMRRLYLEEDFTLRELARRHHCSPNTIRKTLREMPEVTMRPAVNPRPGKERAWR